MVAGGGGGPGWSTWVGRSTWPGWPRCWPGPRWWWSATPGRRTWRRRWGRRWCRCSRRWCRPCGGGPGGCRRCCWATRTAGLRGVAGAGLPGARASVPGRGAGRRGRGRGRPAGSPRPPEESGRGVPRSIRGWRGEGAAVARARVVDDRVRAGAARVPDPGDARTGGRTGWGGPGPGRGRRRRWRSPGRRRPRPRSTWSSCSGRRSWAGWPRSGSGGRRPGREVPAVYLEHNAPQGRVNELRHVAADRDDLVVVHVTHFNDLFWDCGSTPTRVIEHGIVDPGERYSGEVPAAAVVINEAGRRRAGDRDRPAGAAGGGGAARPVRDGVGAAGRDAGGAVGGRPGPGAAARRDGQAAAVPAPGALDLARAVAAGGHAPGDAGGGAGHHRGRRGGAAGGRGGLDPGRGARPTRPGGWSPTPSRPG